MTWYDFNLALMGLLPETPLGRIVEIRTEKDPKKIQKMSSWEREKRLEWQEFKMRKEISNQLKMTIKEREAIVNEQKRRDDALFNMIASL